MVTGPSGPARVGRMSLTLRLISVTRRDIDFELTLLWADINHSGTISKQIAKQSEPGSISMQSAKNSHGRDDSKRNGAEGASGQPRR